MSLMNEALRNLDRSRKYNNFNEKNTHEDLELVWQAKNDSLNDLFDNRFGCAFNNVNNHQGVFVFFRRYFMVKIFLISFLLLIFLYASSAFEYKEKILFKNFSSLPFLYDSTVNDDAMKSFVQINSLVNDFKKNDQNFTNNKNISDRELDSNRVNNKVNNDKELPDKLTKKTEQIALLNDKGYTALANDFLSTPKKNNAMYFFQQVLAVDKYDVLALQGVNSVQRRYQKLIEVHIERHDWEQAEKMLDRFLTIGGDEKTVKKYEQLISHNAVTNTKRDAVTENVSNKPTSINTNQSSFLSVEKSSQHTQKKIEQEAFFRSQQWLQKNQIQKAIDELNAVLNEQYYLTKPSAELLFDLYLRSEDVEAARMIGRHVKNVKKTMLNNTSWDTAYERARIEQVLHGDLAAIEILNSIDIEWLGESSARLYAGLLQMNGDYGLAQNIYRNLLNIYHKNSTYWLGYGVSSDALGQLDNALTGYRKTQRLGGVSSDVQSYVAHRIRVLQSDANLLSHVMEPSW